MSEQAGPAFKPFPMTPDGWPCCAIDPPWRFASNSVAKPGRNAMRHYACMTPQEIAALPVGDVLADDCAVFLWITGPFLAIGAHIPIMKSWGVKPTAIAFDWAKRNKSGHGAFLGTGFTTRRNVEYVILGKRGRSVRRDAGVRSLIVANVREHSRKPDEFYERVERYCDGPRLELFARQSRPGWTSWGDQSTQFDRGAA